jgi:ribosomal protein S18 acetylase RimI-like enzyme
VTVVERATMDDLDAVVEAWLSLAAGQREHGSGLLADGNREQIAATAGNHIFAGGVFVARDDDGLAGFVMFGPESGSYQRDRDRGVVRNLWVRPDRRGEGIGRDLLARAEADLAADGLDAVVLESMADNDGARRFYRRAGYEPHRITFAKELDAGGGRDGDQPDESDNHTN